MDPVNSWAGEPEVTLVSEDGTEVKVHRIFLALYTDQWRQTLQGLQISQLVLLLQDVDGGELEEIVSGIYRPFIVRGDTKDIQDSQAVEKENTIEATAEDISESHIDGGDLVNVEDLAGKQNSDEDIIEVFDDDDALFDYDEIQTSDEGIKVTEAEIDVKQVDVKRSGYTRKLEDTDEELSHARGKYEIIDIPNDQQRSGDGSTMEVPASFKNEITESVVETKSDTNMITESDVETKSDTNEITESDVETKADTNEITESDVETKSDTNEITESDVGTKADTNMITESDVETKADTNMITESDVETKADTNMITESDVETKADTNMITESDVETKADTNMITESDVETKADTNVKTESDVETKADTNMITESDVETKADTNLKIESIVKRFYREGKVWYLCELCDYESRQKRTTRHHVENKHFGIKYVCSKCDMVFNSPKLLNYHDINVHRDAKTRNLGNCDYCDYKADRGTVRNHMNSVHLNLKPYQCEKCDMKYSKNTELKLHVKSAHDKKFDLCDICHKHVKRIKSHKTKQHKEKKCQYCSEIFPKESIYRNHLKNVHGVFKEKDILRCPSCDYTTKSKELLRRHDQTNHNITYIYCDQCEYKTKIKSHLQQHQKQKHDNSFEKYKCDVCDYQCTRSDYLKRHKESLHEKVRYPCDQCGYQATRMQYLEKHLQTIHKQ